MDQYEPNYIVVVFPDVKALGPFTEYKTAKAYAEFVEVVSDMHNCSKCCKVFGTVFDENLWGAPANYAGMSGNEAHGSPRETPEPRQAMGVAANTNEGNGEAPGGSVNAPKNTDAGGYPAPTYAEIFGETK